MMQKVAIFGQAYSIVAKQEIELLLTILLKNNIKIVVEEHFFELLKTEKITTNTFETFSNFKDLDTNFDAMFTIGGDGTILRAITYIRNLNIPLIGINTGRLGFLATINKKHIQENVQQILNNEFEVQERSLIEISTNTHQKEFEELNFALNEVTIARKNTTSMIGVKTSLNGEYLTNYWADGLIIATPTGSTGYSLSCNGPVIAPNSKNVVITPIAPHNLNARPMVIADDTTITLEVDSREKEFLVSLDSRITSVPINTIITIKKANFRIKTLIPKNQSFLKTLRSKLLWGEDTRNKHN